MRPGNQFYKGNDQKDIFIYVSLFENLCYKKKIQ